LTKRRITLGQIGKDRLVCGTPCQDCAAHQFCWRWKREFPYEQGKNTDFLRNPPFAERLLEQKVLLSQWFICIFAVQINREKIDA